MRSLVLLSVAGLSAVSLADTLTGDVSYLSRIALPTTARVTVQISDVSLADAVSPTLASTEIETNGRQVPIPFSLEYDRSHLKQGHRYNVQARISEGDRLLFVSTTAIPLPTTEAPLHIVVSQVPDQPKAELGVTFFATFLDGVTLKNYPGTRRVSLRLDEKGGSFGGFAGVNTYGGSFARNGHNIKFGPARATKMAGDAGSMKIEQSLFKVLGQATAAKYFGTYLVLYKNGTVIFKGYSNRSE